mmetsp:Transcript_50606/g.105720  ORF Transcript_50606/g.105720 Transcript_50606/m.105720 type:complete len:81 (+) Transcript_50606:285-527(+)
MQRIIKARRKEERGGNDEIRTSDSDGLIDQPDKQRTSASGSSVLVACALTLLGVGCDQVFQHPLDVAEWHRLEVPPDERP